MNQGFGGESPRQHSHDGYRKAARYLVLIESGGSSVARLFVDSRELVAEFDAGTEEIATMTRGLAPATGASGAEWDQALQAHSAVERAAAAVYTLDI